MKAIIFDVDDTMYDRIDSFVRTFDRLFGDRWDPDRDQLHQRFMSRGDELFAASMDGTISLEEMRVRRLMLAMEDFGMIITEKEALHFVDVYLYEQQHIRCSDHVEEMLAFCAASDWFCGILTNGKSDYQREKCISLGLDRWFSPETIIASGDIGYNKPDLRLFCHAQEQWNLDPANTWFVGDSYSHDILGAHAAGWKTLWLDKYHQSPSIDHSAADLVVQDRKAMSDALHRLIYPE